jgi:outer membrane protein assembly factor BamB
MILWPEMRATPTFAILAGLGGCCSVGLASCGARTGLVDDAAPSGSGVEDASSGPVPQSAGCPAPSGLQAHAPWPMFMRCATHQGWTEVLGPAARPTLRWSFAGPPDADRPTGNASPVVAADGTIYVAMEDNPLYALRPDGTLLWSASIRASAQSPAIGADGTVYVADDEATLHAFDPSGQPKWRYASPQAGSFSTSGAPSLGPDGTAYFGNGDRLDAIMPSGVLAWTVTAPGGVSPAVGPNGVIYAAQSAPAFPPNPGNMPTAQNVLLAVSPSGAVLWPFGLDGGVTASNSPPGVAPDGNILFDVVTVPQMPGSTTPTATLDALTPGGGLRWSSASASGNGASTAFAVASSGTIYAATGDGLAALTPGGQMLWQVLLPGGGVFSPPITDGAGIVYVATETEVVAVSPAGAVLWSFVVSRATTLAIGGDGTLYAGTTQATLVALR